VVFVVDTVKLGQVFYKYFGFPLSVSFHQCSIAIFHLSTTDTLSNWQHHQIKHFSVLAVTDSAHHNCYFVGKTQQKILEMMENPADTNLQKHC
jgi:hypothetical protein